MHCARSQELVHSLRASRGHRNDSVVLAQWAKRKRLGIVEALPALHGSGASGMEAQIAQLQSDVLQVSGLLQALQQQVTNDREETRILAAESASTTASLESLQAFKQQ
eukprot:1998494-Alexandrium_andersonii.AAC.1